MHTDVRELKLIDPKIIVATLQLRSFFYLFFFWRLLFILFIVTCKHPYLPVRTFHRIL